MNSRPGSAAAPRKVLAPDATPGDVVFVNGEAALVTARDAGSLSFGFDAEHERWFDRRTRVLYDERGRLAGRVTRERFRYEPEECACGTRLESCRGCGEARCLACDPYGEPDGCDRSPRPQGASKSFDSGWGVGDG